MMAENGPRRSYRAPLFIAILAVGAMFTFYAPQLYWPIIQMDDFPILAESWTGQRARENLWKPFNEHVAPLSRLATWALAGTPTSVPLLTALQGPLAVLLGMGLMYLFIRNERQSAFLGIVALILFGVTTTYHEAVAWYAASFTLLALDTTLLALLTAQRWQQRGGWHWLILTGGLAALAPAWFASGILAGPLVALYLLVRPTEPTDAVTPSHLRRACASLLSLAGTGLFLALAIPRNIDHILHLEHYSGRTAIEAIDIRIGAERTTRSLIDHLFLGTCGISFVPLPVAVVIVGLCVLLVAATWWWRRAPRRDLLLLGCGFILLSDLLVHSARAAWAYDHVHSWTRYDVFPHAGLVIIICGGLAKPIENAWTVRQRRTLLLVCATLFLINLPRGLLMGLRLATWESVTRPVEQMSERWHEQSEVLQRIEATDAFCREHAIDAATAREVLGIIFVPECADCNGWLFLRGSETPEPVSEEEARRLLNSFQLNR